VLGAIAGLSGFHVSRFFEFPLIHFILPLLPRPYNAAICSIWLCVSIDLELSSPIFCDTDFDFHRPFSSFRDLRPTFFDISNWTISSATFPKAPWAFQPSAIVFTMYFDLIRPSWIFRFRRSLRFPRSATFGPRVRSRGSLIAQNVGLLQMWRVWIRDIKGRVVSGVFMMASKMFGIDPLKWENAGKMKTGREFLCLSYCCWSKGRWAWLKYEHNIKSWTGKELTRHCQSFYIWLSISLAARELSHRTFSCCITLTQFQRPLKNTWELVDQYLHIA
jgi:hypothetical protein